MKEDARLKKNKQIRNSLIKTKQKRESQICKVFQIKIQNNSLNKEQIEALKMQFIEAKWIINSILSWSEIPENKIWEYKINKTIIHKDKNMNNIETELKFLGSQMKQSIISDLISNIRTLSTLKKKDKKVGKLKYRKEIKAINFKQHGITYKILNKNTIKIQNIPGKLHVNGLSQIFNRKNKIKHNIDIANAKLLNTSSGYYLAITTYWNKETKIFKEKEIGIDFGCSTAITLSNGIKFNANIQESDRLKKLQRKLAKQQYNKKWSKGIEKTIKLIRKEYQKLSNKKNDLANKIVHEILQYENIYMQDENLQGWQKKGFGKTIQHSVLGRIKAKIKNKAKFILDRFESTTKMCYNCGQINKIKLNERIYRCDCGIEPEDRDIHAAKNMIILGKIRLGMGRTEFTRMDNLSDFESFEKQSRIGWNSKVSSIDLMSKSDSISLEDATSLA